MSTSGTFNFNPSLGDMVLYSYSLCGLRRTSLVQEHFTDARIAANMLNARWSADGVNLWAVDLQTIPLVQGTSTYTVPSNTVTILDAYTVQNANGASFNRLMLPISRSEWASYPNPTQQGQPTVFWFDRLLAPTVTLWPVPDGQESSFNYYRMRQIQDSNLTDQTQLEIPYYFLEAFAFGLAARLAMIYAPEKAVALKAMADEAYDIAAAQNIETAQVYISPQIQAYFKP